VSDLAKINRWPLRWKLFALMWLLSLLPALVIAWININTLAVLGARLAAQTGQSLSDQTRASLEQQADDYADLLAQQRQALELLVHLQAREAERVLRKPPVTSNAVYWRDDYIRGDSALALDTQKKYFQQSSATTRSPLPVSYEHLVMHAVPGVSTNALTTAATQLSEMLGMLREVHATQTDLVYWQYTALESGLYAGYPGHGGYPANFDPRGQAWYQAQKTMPAVTWTGPHWDAVTRLRMISVTMPLFDPQHHFIGVTGIDVRLTRLLQTVHLPLHLADSSDVLLTNIRPRVHTAKIEILARQRDVEPSGDWRNSPRVDSFSADNPRETAKIAADMRSGRGGFLQIRYRERDMFCIYRAFDPHGAYVLFLVPAESAARPAEVAAEYALATTRREIESLVPITLLAATLAALAAFLGARVITNPIKRLSDAVQEVTDGNFNVRVDIKTGDELENLGRGFNRMVPQIEAHAYMKKALIVAREVQQGLLPASAPTTDVLDLHGICLYADETGGDYYDYLDLRPRDLPVLGVALGDVSGHGVASALLMATVRALLHAADIQPRELGRTLTSLNQGLAQDLETGRFMTLFLLMFDLGARQVNWTSAGHDPVLCYRAQDGSHFELAGTDIPLGIDRHWQFGATGSQSFSAGDVFLLATDGAWETRSPTGERFGKHRLKENLQRFAPLTAAAICREMTQAIAAFRAGAGLRDDLTLVVVKVREDTMGTTSAVPAIH
jgi:phosphoserine phosphatase RsbU/P